MFLTKGFFPNTCSDRRSVRFMFPRGGLLTWAGGPLELGDDRMEPLVLSVVVYQLVLPLGPGGLEYSGEKLAFG